MIQPWKRISSRKLGSYRVFEIRSELKVSPRTGEAHDFFVIESVNWVNVVAITESGQLIMVEQYRHGSDTIELEVPGGMIDTGDGSPISAGLRELREETGYEGTDPILLGQVFPNPAIMNNICYTVLVRGCQLKHPTVFDHSEDLATRLVPVETIPGLVSSGRIKHSLVIVALFHYELWKSRGPGS